MKSSIAEVRRGFLRTAVCLGAVFGSMLASHPVCAYETGGPGDGEFVISDEERARIAEALPEKAPAVPGKPRKLLIFDLNVVYGGHPSRFYANWALQEMGRKTGAFEAVISRDPAVFERESLARFDAVFLNNTVGNQFSDPALRRNLREFVYAGGGLMGVHG
ncbi:MAG TPA: ThuA domain-containing protein, partial [Candidatus Hydrogenedentes bacterium]|nr:ThuA domain-containing protein [Candidatus Hydrogenedentota bacterium]